MASKREQILRAWYRQELGRLTGEISPYTPRRVTGRHGLLRYDGSFIYESDGTSLANIYLSNDANPMCRMVLPNIMSLNSHRMIERVLSKEGCTIHGIPVGVISEAQIRERTIEVIDQEKRPLFLRARAQLIKAVVSPRWSNHQRPAYFLSDYDRAERGLSYFFCELPPGAEPTTIAEAYEALKPRAVLMAQAEGVRVKRQGDMFLIPQKNFRPKPDADVLRNEYLHATNHRGEQVTIHDGLTYVRGRVQHRPIGRKPDHRRLDLRYRWHLCVKNTVPVTR